MTITLRIGLGFLAVMELVLGIWAAFFPRNFYDAVPTVNLTPPYSEHLLRDFGSATLGIAVVLVAAAIWPTTRLAVVALLAYFVWAGPHFVFHLGHLHGATQIEATVLMLGLGISAALPIALLIVAIARHRRDRLTP